jgi:hypothetical protein
VNWVLDLDVRSFFDKVDHNWMIQFVEHRIRDKRIVRLIQKWLKAGVMEQGQWYETKEGTPQGSVISPSLGSRLCSCLVSPVPPVSIFSHTTTLFGFGSVSCSQRLFHRQKKYDASRGILINRLMVSTGK